MDEIPLVKGAALTAQMNLKMEAELDKDIRLLKAHRVDVQEIVRAFLRKEIPKIKQKLGA